MPKDAEKLIVGTIPPPRFSTGGLFEQDVDFCYGSKYGLLWPILERLFESDLDFENTARAIEQRKQLLTKNRIGICDMVESCEREREEASDLGMKMSFCAIFRMCCQLIPRSDGSCSWGEIQRMDPNTCFRNRSKSLGCALGSCRQKVLAYTSWISAAAGSNAFH